MKNEFIRLHANCIIVHGYTRSLICDLQKEISHFIPNTLYEISLLFNSHSIHEIREKYDQESVQYINEYIHFLVEKELAFYCSLDEIALFPPLSLAWDYPALISNAIIDIDKQSCFDFESIFDQLEELGCRDVQIRLFDNMPMTFLFELLKSTEFRTIKSIQIYAKYDASISNETYINITRNFPRVIGLFLYSAGSTELIAPDIAPTITIAKLNQDINFELHCGIISTAYFTTTMGLFTESLSHNNCLNRKLSIAKNGDIKNCPSLKESYGNIAITKLKEALNITGFKKYWDITKDKIVGCKDCEFRNICTDCRAFKDEPDNLFSKPLKCGYDPYTAVWSEWSQNPLKKAAIEYYNLK